MIIMIIVIIMIIIIIITIITNLLSMRVIGALWKLSPIFHILHCSPEIAELPVSLFNNVYPPLLLIRLGFFAPFIVPFKVVLTRSDEQEI